tara:strand:- start:707 stop:1336 length:630 start_codon:yes stop_codon:yes gene_type:complete
MEANQEINLSDSLETAVDFETYGLFMIPVTKYNCSDLVDDVLKWARNQDFVKHDRNAISHNIQQIGETNQILKDLPHVKSALLNVARKHNETGLNYASNFEISDCYLEVAHQGAIYAPHEHSNCLFSGTFFISYDKEAHSYLKFKRNTISNTYPIMMLPYSTMTAFNLQEATIPYAAGDVVIYPSNLTHGFDSNPTDNRIALTFNVIPI